MDTVDMIHTTEEPSNTLICYEFKGPIPTGYEQMDPMGYAHLLCVQQIADPSVSMQLIQVKGWKNQIVLKTQTNNPRTLQSIKQDMVKQFDYVTYQSIPCTNNNNNAIHNAENHSEHKDDIKYESQSTITPMANNDLHYSNSDTNNNDIDYSADEESGNDDYLPTKPQTKRHKKPRKKIKMERQMREHNKHRLSNNSNDNISYKQYKPNTQRQSESSTRSKSHSKSPKSNDSEQKVSLQSQIKRNPIIAPPPNPSNSSDNNTNLYPYHHQSPIIDTSPPKPHFNIQYNNNNDNKNNFESKVEPNNNMKRPNLPRFDFGSGIQYENETTSEDKGNIPTDAFADEYKLHPPPPSFNENDFGQTFRYHKPQTQYNQNNYVPPPVPAPNNSYVSQNINVQPPVPPQQNKKKERTGPAVLKGIFCGGSDTQSHDEYLQFHTQSGVTYSEKLKKSAKREKNPKNFFLLPILMRLDSGYNIGDKIGGCDYGFHCDSGVMDGKLKGRDPHKYRGVDYKSDNERDEKKEIIEAGPKDPTQLMNEVMQYKGLVREKDYNWQEVYGHNSRTAFVFQFFLRNQSLGQAGGNNKKDARRNCSKAALNNLKIDSEFRDIISRKEKGIGGSGKKDSAPNGYEYPTCAVGLMNNKKYKYFEINSSHNVIRLENYNGYNANINRYQMEIFMDRDNKERQCERYNPNVEELYAKEWDRFQSERRNIPRHGHEYLDENGNFCKRFTDRKEKELWKAIWKFYKPKGRVYYNDGRSAKSGSNSNKSQPSQYNAGRFNGNNNGNNKENIEKRNDWKHYLIYDFDGTIYSQRLYRKLNKMTDSTVYVNNMSSKEIMEQGWKLNRIEPLKNHFKVLRQYKSYGLCVVLHTFHHEEHLKILFSKIEMHMNDIFDIIVCNKHELHAQNQPNGSYSKNAFVEKFCREYNVSNYNNVLFVDDDPCVMQDLKYCQVYIPKRNKRNGIDPHDMKEIENIITVKFGWRNGNNSNNYGNRNNSNNNYGNSDEYKVHNNNNNSYNNNNNYNENNSNRSHHSHHSNNNNSVGTEERCVACRENKKDMKFSQTIQVWFCKTCYWQNKDQYQMDVQTPNQY